MADDQGNRAERPATLVLLAVDAMRDAGVPDMSRRQAEATLEFVRRVFGKIAEETQPIFARSPGGVEEFVGYAL